MVKQEDTVLVQIQGIVGLLRIVITSTILALALVGQQLQQAATELREELAADIILTLKELDGPASTQFGHVLGLAPSSFNFL